VLSGRSFGDGIAFQQYKKKEERKRMKRKKQKKIIHIEIKQTNTHTRT
jgi:hypothetical protein